MYRDDDPFGFFEDEQVASTGHITIEQCLATGKNGIDIPNETYHVLPGISGTKLKLLEVSNKHFDNSKLFDPGDRDCLVNGSLLHTMVLEQHDVEKNYVIMPKFDGRTNAGKAQAAEFKASNNKIVIPEDDYQRCEKMATNVLAIYGDIIEAGIKERSYFAEINGVICKARPDCLTGPDDYDLKSFTPKNMDFSDLALERHIDRMGYQLSAAFRNIVRRSLGHDVGDSYLIFVSTSPGHMTRTIQIDPQWIADSEEIVHQLIYKRSVYINNDIELSEISVIDDRNRKYNAY